MSRVRATVVIPTTGDRGPLLPYCVGSVLEQSVEDLEVFVIGDGLDAEGTETMADLIGADDRVRFFPFDKGTRRGETNRHAVLTEHADSDIVTYLCDRDLYLPHHIEVMLGLLDNADFAYTLRFRIMKNDRLNPGTFPNLIDPAVRSGRRPVVPLSFAGHRLDAYHRLPEGWRTTPEDRGTDGYMWEQFLDQPWCRVAASARPSVLTFKRGPHPGWPTQERRAILEQWQPALADPEVEHQLATDLLAAHVAQASPLGDQKRRHRSRRSTAKMRAKSAVSLARTRRARRRAS